MTCIIIKLDSALNQFLSARRPLRILSCLRHQSQTGQFSCRRVYFFVAPALTLPLLEVFLAVGSSELFFSQPARTCQASGICGSSSIGGRMACTRSNFCLHRLAQSSQPGPTVLTCGVVLALPDQLAAAVDLSQMHCSDPWCTRDTSSRLSQPSQAAAADPCQMSTNVPA